MSGGYTKALNAGAEGIPRAWKHHEWECVILSFPS
jgi:hypothetical protein